MGIDAGHQTFVHGTASGIIDGNDCATGVGNCSRPGGEGSVFGIENKGGGNARSGDEKARGRTRRRVPYDAGRGCWCRRPRVRLAGSGLARRSGHGIIWQRDCHLERYLGTRTVVKGRAARGIISDPEGARGRRKRHTPGISQGRIGIWGYSW